MPVTEPLPADLPEWDPDPADVEDPGAPKRAQGWEVGEAPPSKWFNWQWQLVFYWIRYIKDVLANSYDVQHNTTSGTHSDITADSITSDEGAFGSTSQMTIDANGDLTTSGNVSANTLDCGSASQMTVSAAGAIDTSGDISTSATVESPSYTFPNAGILTAQRQHITQTDSYVTATGTAGTLLAATTAYNVPRIFLNNGEECVLPFKMQANTDLEAVKFWVYPSGGTAYTIEWEIVKMDEATGLWGTVDATLDGSESDTGLTAGTIYDITVTLADFGGPNVAGHGMHAANLGLYGIRLKNNNAVDVAIIQYEPRVWMYSIETMLGAP